MTDYAVRYKEITIKEITLKFGKEDAQDMAKEDIESGHFNPLGSITLNKYPFFEVISVIEIRKPGGRDDCNKQCEDCHKLFDCPDSNVGEDI